MRLIPILGMAIPLLGMPANAVEVKFNDNGSAVITLTVEEVIYCMNNGGCMVVTTKEIHAAVAQVCGQAISQ